MTSTRPLALITGASAGIGAAYARRLAKDGYDLVLVARRRERLEELARELETQHGAQAEALPADLTLEAGLKAVEERLAQAKSIDFLLNNAGFGTSGRFYDASMESQEAMHRLHIMATMRLTHPALRKMIAQNHGAIVNVSSVAAFICRPGMTSYHATKSWINHFTEGIYLELKYDGSPVRVQALCPGYTLTEFHDVMGFDRKQVPASWWMRVDEVVDASVKGLARGDLFVVPGWRYKAIVLLLRLMPQSLSHVAALKSVPRSGRIR